MKPDGPAWLATTRDSGKLAVAVAAGVVFGYAISLSALFTRHVWILDAQGRPNVGDFLAFWSAGHLALNGAAVSAYDPHLQHLAEAAATGHGFDGALEWPYPPLFFFVVAVLASLPYAGAFVAWCVATLALYAGVTAKIAAKGSAAVVACAAPAVLATLMAGQNGLLTASLIGLSLLLIEKRPALGGLVLGLLSYKPQFGILFPLALAAGGYWRSFAWAGAAALVSNGLAAFVFGAGTVDGFFHAMGVTGDMRVAHAGMGWNKLQSVYGLLRALHCPGVAAWAAQACASAAVAVGVVASWRSRIAYALKAAILAAAIPLATPYILVYDLPMLSVAVAFLFRHRNFDGVEIVLLGVTIPCVFALPWLPIPSAFFASLAVGAIVARRCHAMFPRRIDPTWAKASLSSSE
ncbi:MAG TPA: glycosyltransferase family 87 protein [Rhizomicrobium sp.]|nr:glycosyltransferase family 87 protein [Rhizomicrobium sp.]